MIKSWRSFLRESMHDVTNECNWPGHAGHGGPTKDGTIIKVGLASVL